MPYLDHSIWLQQIRGRGAGKPDGRGFALQQVFEGTPQEVKQVVNAASEAMRQGNYEDAIVSLRTIRTRENITMEQGLALHHSAVAMEAQLIRAMESGDEKAKRAYQLLKAFKRD